MIDFKSPTVLIVGGIGVIAVFLLMRNNSSSSTSNTSQTQGTTPVGGSYSYLDGTGMQHITATDPNGNLVGYSNLPPDTSNPQPNQLSSYVGSMSGQYLVSPYGGTTPYYSLQSFPGYQGWMDQFANQQLTAQ
jgi:hypothetical protein